MNTIDEGTLIRRVSSELTSIAQGYRLLIAFSGGPDSFFLLDTLYESIKAGAAFTLGLAYVDHRLRDPEELAREVSLVREAALRYDVELHLLDCGEHGVIDAAASRGKGVEEAARHLRYELLEACRTSFGYDHILTAHHLDDQVETLLMRFFKGSGVHGLHGILPRQGATLRPLLSFRKEEILSYLKQRKLEFSVDSTNGTDAYERNRLRSSLIPVVRELYPGYEQALVSLAEKMSSAASYLDGTLRDLDDLIQIGDDALSCARGAFDSLHPYGRAELLYRMWNMMQSERSGLPYQVIRKLVQDGTTGYAGSCRLFSYEGVTCNLRKERLFLSRMVVPEHKNRYLKVIASECTELFPGCILISRETDGVDREALCIPASAIDGKLVVRSFMEGDSLETASGTKRVLKLFNDWNVPVQERWKIPLVLVRDRIIGVLGKAFGYHDRIAGSAYVENTTKSGTMVSVHIVSAGDMFEFER